MSAAESPGTHVPPDLPVDDGEELYRCIAHPHWWDEQERRITSAAFKFPCFSVDVASLVGSPDVTLARFRPGTGLVAFSCRAARELGCEIRLEVDPNCPDNLLHAHVYMPAERRKAAARRLADACTVVHEPSFGEPQSSP